MRRFRYRIRLPRIVLPRNFHLHLLLLTVLALMGFCFYIVEYNLKPALVAFAENHGRIVATNAVTSALREEVIPEIGYEDLYKMERDDRGRVALMQPNTRMVSSISAAAAGTIQQRLEEVGRRQIPVPLFRALGIELLAGLGPEVSLRVFPIGTVRATIDDRFEAAGINQTRHRVYLEVEGRVKIVVPLVSRMSSFQTQVAVAEGIIVGEVPEFYLELGR